MIRNYLIIALRNFLRQRLFSFVNVAGLATGLACALIIFLWVKDEVEKDKFHDDMDRIYHVVLNLHNPEGTITWAVTPGPLAEEIKHNIAEVEFVAPVADDGPRLIQVDEKNFSVPGYFTYPEFFKIFNYQIVEGNPTNPLDDPSAIILTKSLAKRLFGDTPALGKTLKLQGENDLKVTAIMEDNPIQSSLSFEFIAHFDVHKKYRGQEWGNADYPLFIKFREVFNASETQDKINKHVAKINNLSEEESKRFQYYLQPFGDRYLYNQFENGVPSGGRIKYVKIFTLVAIFILLVACINFMNLSTARATVRHKEIGVRKVIGAQRKSIIGQFLSESILITGASMVIALVLVQLILPSFNILVSKQITINFLSAEFLVPTIIITLVTGALAGSYPALILSGVNTVKALKGLTSSVGQGAPLRKFLVIFQFSISVILVVSALVIFQQIQFIRSKNLGFNKENVIVFPGRGVKDFDTFKKELLKVPGVINVSTANENITNVENQNSSFSWPGKPEDSRTYVRTMVVGYDFIETMGLHITQGRSFSEEHNDINNVIINQKMASLMQIENLIGLETSQWGEKGKLVGIVDDFHIRSMTESIDPMVIMLNPEWTGRYYIKLEGDKLQQTISGIEESWKQASPLYAFEYSFLDQSFEKLYKQEQVIGTLSVGFTFIAILISALGLLGLASYATERKKKSISIRKVLGASVSGLIINMSKEFLVLTSMALLIGCPIAYYFLNQFLEGYAYRININVIVFVISGIGLLSLTLLVTLIQVSRAASANPVENLRNE